MATLNENIDRIENAKIAIKDAIVVKGVAVDDTDLIDTYADKINEIQISSIPLTSLDFGNAGYIVEDPTFMKIQSDLAYTKTKYDEWEAKTDKTSAEQLYQVDKKLVYAPLIDLSSCTNCKLMFDYCTSLTTIPKLDTSKVIEFNYMFCRCTSLITIPQLDTSSCTICSSMFADCKLLTSVPQLNFSKVTNAMGCFSNCTSLTSVELTGGIKPDCECASMFSHITTDGVLKIHTGNGITRESYQPVIDQLPSTWTVEEIVDPTV